MKKIKIDIGAFLKLTLEKIKQRYIYILILISVTLFFTLFYKEMIVEESFPLKEAEAQEVLNDTIIQEIDIQYNNPKYISLKVGSQNSNVSAKYKVEILQNDESIAHVDIDTANLPQEGEISIILPELNNIERSSLKMQITSYSDDVSKENSLVIYTSSGSGKNSMFVNGINSDVTVYTTVVYPKFSAFYWTFIILLFISGCILILFVDVKKIHNSVCAVILVVGSFCVLLNPVLDTPDDHAHLARADLTSRGILFISGDIEQYKVTNSVWDILQDSYSTLKTTTLLDSPVDNEAYNNSNNYANTNLFIGYIPQAIGILIGKIIGVNSMLIMILGRLMNLIIYAFMVRLALKIIPILKIPMSIIAVMPMSIFIASSFNPDATTYWMAMFVIAYFFYVYKKENIDMKNIVIFSVLSILLGLVKLPYCMLGGLIIFIPKDKFKSKKLYYQSFLFVFLVAAVSLGWGLSAMSNQLVSPGSDKYFIDNDVDTKRQISYILSYPTSFVKNFSKALLDNIKAYVEQLNTFGWLSYGFTTGVAQIYTIFLGSIIVLYPNECIIKRKTKYGITLVSAGIYVVTCLILYLSWTTVGSKSIAGVQGRYFIPLLILLASLSPEKAVDDDKRKENINTKFIVTSIIFAIIFIITIMNKYY